MDSSDNTTTDLQDEKIAPNIVKEYRDEVTKTMKDEQYTNISSNYHRSILQDFESSLRTKIDLVEDDIRLVLDEYVSSFITYELELGIHAFKGLSEALFNILKPEDEEFNNTNVIEFDNITMKTKLVVRAGIVAMKLDEKRVLVLSWVSTKDGILHIITNTLDIIFLT